MTVISFQDVLLLHNALHSRFRKYNIELQAAASTESAACAVANGTQVVQYFRSSTTAHTVEAMMGRDVPGRTIEVRRHPVIEMRPTAAGLAIELIIAPHAWWDQQNLIAKLSVEKHLQKFHRLVARLDHQYYLGFWHGVQLGDMHLTAKQLAHPSACKQWMSTFCDGQDWLRIGVWYSAPQCFEENFIGDAFHRLQELYEIYKFIAWTSNNDFRTIQQRKNNNNVCYV
jgi:hypothetical protein